MLKFQHNDSDGGHTLQRELAVMKKLHQNPATGTMYLLKPVEGIEDVVGVTAILTTYYELNLKHASIFHYWKDKEAPIKRLAKGLCHGLHHMHQRGFAHRDIKPDNILLQNVEGDPVIIDFGLSNATKPGAGTSKYLAPEQKRGDKGELKGTEWWIVNGWDQRLFDSYSLGIVLDNCFKGHVTPPPLAQDFISKLMKRDAR